MPIDIEKDDIKTALKKLKAREDTLRRFEALAHLGSWEVNLKTNKSFWSEQSYKLYGYKEKFEPTLDTFFGNILPEYIEPAKQILKEALKSKKPISFYAKAKRQDGKVIDIFLNGQIIYDEVEEGYKLIGITQDITEYLSLKKEVDELYNIIDKSDNEIYIIDANNYRYLYVNEGAVKATGFTKEEFLNNDIFFINPYLTKEKANILREDVFKNDFIINRTIHKRKDGSEYYVQAYIQTIKYKGRDAAIIFESDITELVKAEQKQKEQANMLENIHDGVFAVDFEGKLHNVNKSAVKILGFDDKSELKKKTIYDIYSNTNKIELKDILEEAKKACGDCHKNIEVYLIKKNGIKILCDLSITPLYDDKGQVYATAWLFENITDKKVKELLLKNQSKALEYQAYHDILTNLPNRLLLNDRIEQTINFAKRYNNKFALMFIDLDRFKYINDTYGHHFGDSILLEITKRLKNIIRKEDTLARIGGDEFVLLVRNVKEKENLKKIADKILNIFKEPVIIKDKSMYLSASIGISLFPDDSEEKNELLKFADLAMYKAKELGKGRFEFYSKDMSSKALAVTDIEQKLRNAIVKKDFEIYYQPQYDILQNKVVGMEALVRWVDDKGRMIPPEQFLEIAYESGLIIDIDRIVMDKVLSQVSFWKKAGLYAGRVSVNLNIQQLLKNDFLDFLQKSIKKYDFDADMLEFEVTETEIMKDPQKSIDALNAIHKIGIKLSVDDFGTGYSSLAYLKKLPIDKVKIDRAFIMDMHNNKEDKQIVNAIISLAKSLNLEIIAEGVELKEHVEILKILGCPLIQGYFISKPVNSNEFKERFIV